LATLFYHLETKKNALAITTKIVNYY